MQSTLQLGRLDDHRRPAVLLRAPLPDPNYVRPRGGPAHGLGRGPVQPDPFAARTTPTQRAADPLGDNSAVPADGDFGTLGEGGLGSTGTGFTRLRAPTVDLYSYNPATPRPGQLADGHAAESGNRLVLTPQPGHDTAGRPLPALHAQPGRAGRASTPGSSTSTATSSTASSWATRRAEPAAYEDLLPTGAVSRGHSRATASAGGAFMTGFAVVPTGNIVLRPARLPGRSPAPLHGSRRQPGQALLDPGPRGRPQARPRPTRPRPQRRAEQQPVLPLGLQLRFTTATATAGSTARPSMRPRSSRSSGPVVIVALPGTPQRDPITGNISQQTFVLQAPSGSDPVINDGSASCPSTPRWSSPRARRSSSRTRRCSSRTRAARSRSWASRPRPAGQLHVVRRRQRSAATPTTTASNTAPTRRLGRHRPAELRQQAARAGRPVPGRRHPRRAQRRTADLRSRRRAVDRQLRDLSYAGGAVPQTRATSATTPSRSSTAGRRSPTTASPTTAGGAACKAAIAADLDSFREDDMARGPLVRRATVSRTASTASGSWPRTTGVAEPTNAMTYPDNPRLGGSQNYTFDDPLPYVLRRG